MAEWSVTIEAIDPKLEPAPSADDVEELLDVLPPASLSYGPGRYTVQMLVESDNLQTALSDAAQYYSDAIAKLSLPNWTVVRAEVITADALALEVATPNLPALLGVAELAGLLGVSRQRASELARSESFPRPVASLASGPVWLEPAVLRYAEEWTRRPGRPKKVASR
jgi:hypothetical protein